MKDDGKVVEALTYDKLVLEDDGFLGIPVFDAKEIHIIKNNLNIDEGLIKIGRAHV